MSPRSVPDCTGGGGRPLAQAAASALPPSAVSHARYLCKRLHMRFADVKLLVGLWTIRADLEKAKWPEAPDAAIHECYVNNHD